MALILKSPRALSAQKLAAALEMVIDERVADFKPADARLIKQLLVRRLVESQRPNHNQGAMH